MAFVRVQQLNGRLASAVRIEYVKGREGDIAKGTVTIISNTRRRSGRDRADEATAVQWTLWGAQAESAAAYLGKGARVNVVGHLRNNNYTDSAGREVFSFGFTVEDLDYLDSKAESEARKRGHQEWTEAYDRQLKASSRVVTPGRGARGGDPRLVKPA
jgi:single-stranded DNA-binding protein